MMKNTILIALGCLVAWSGLAPAAGPLPQRWNYIRFNMADDAARDKLIGLLRLSKECGCTHILLSESRMARLCEPQAEEYYRNVKQVLTVAKELDLRIIPMVFHIGYGGRYLHFDGNLMAALPVKDAPFVVKGGLAEPDPAAALPIASGGFEDADGDKPAGWEGRLLPGKNVFIDTQVKHGGKQSLRISNLTTLTGRGESSIELAQTLKVRPFQYYKVVIWGKWDKKYPHLLDVRAGKGGRSLTPTEAWFGKPGPDGWAKFETTFNTLDSDTIRLSLGQAANPGNVWIDDVSVEPAGLMLIVRRAAAPLTVTSEDHATVYKEGEDFKPVFDPLLNQKPFAGELDVTHKPAALELTPASRIKDGQRLWLSYFHTMRIGSDQDVVSIQEPKLLEVMDHDIQGVSKSWPSTGYFMNYDEIRMGGWEPQPEGKDLTPGQLLAEHARKGYDLIRKYDPKATVYTWSDMFSPFHNARPAGGKGPYWLARGTWDGSWEGLPKDVVILNWYSPRAEGLEFFAKRGHQQVLCGYYDPPAGKRTEGMRANINGWMTASRGVPGVLGFMYTTWKNNYAPMKEYFQLLDSHGQWSATMPAAAGK